MTAADEQHLIQQAKQGSHEAFRCLVERHMKQAYNIAYRFVSDHDDADEVAQEAFVRAFRSLGSFRGDAGFSTWLYRIVVNLSLNQVRQNKKRMEREIDPDRAVMISTATVAPGEQGILTGHLQQALNELPTLQRSVVILRHIDGLSTREVSQILHCSEGTVKTHLFRGLKKLRAKLHFLKEEVD